MQRLAGCMASLGRFISKFGERALPFFKIMKRSGTFKWMPQAEKAFEDLKRYLASPPVMVAPRTCEHLKLYLSATPQTASAVLVVEREEPVLHKKSATTPKPKPPDEELDKGAGSTNPTPGPEPHAEPAPSPDLAKEPEEPPQANPLEGPEEPPQADSVAPKLTTLVEHPVYFVSTVLRDARERYPMQQKLLVALLIASR